MKVKKSEEEEEENIVRFKRDRQISGLRQGPPFAQRRPPNRLQGAVGGGNGWGRGRCCGRGEWGGGVCSGQGNWPGGVGKGKGCGLWAGENGCRV